MNVPDFLNMCNVLKKQKADGVIGTIPGIKSFGFSNTTLAKLAMQQKNEKEGKRKKYWEEIKRDRLLLPSFQDEAK